MSEDKIREITLNYSLCTDYKSLRNQITIDLRALFKNETRLIKREVKLKLEMLVDTGASHTIIPAEKLGLYNLDKFKAAYPDSGITTGTGIVNDMIIESYPIFLESLWIGNIELPEIIVYVSFCDNMSTALLGMDILGLFNFSIDTERSLINFKETRSLHNKLIEGTSIYNPDNTNVRSLYDVKKDRDRLTITDMEANYVNNLIKDSTIP